MTRVQGVCAAGVLGVILLVILAAQGDGRRIAVLLGGLLIVSPCVALFLSLPPAPRHPIKRKTDDDLWGDL